MRIRQLAHAVCCWPGCWSRLLLHCALPRPCAPMLGADAARPCAPKPVKAHMCIPACVARDFIGWMHACTKSCTLVVMRSVHARPCTCSPLCTVQCRPVRALRPHAPRQASTHTHALARASGQLPDSSAREPTHPSAQASKQGGLWRYRVRRGRVRPVHGTHTLAGRQVLVARPHGAVQRNQTHT